MTGTRLRITLVALAVTLAGLVALGSGADAASAAGPVSGPLKVAGRWVVDQQGRVVQLHGFNIVQKTDPFVPTRLGEDDARFLQDEGMTLARIGFIWAAAEPQPGQYDDAYIRRVLDVNELLARHGVRTLLDFHQDAWNDGKGGDGAPAWATLGQPIPLGIDHFQKFWDDAPAADGVGIQTRFVALWQHVVRLLDESPASDNVYGLDPFNEPYAGTKRPTCPIFTPCPAFEQDELTRFYTRFITAVRGAGDSHIIWPESNPDTGLVPAVPAPTLPKFADSQTGYNYHQYCTVTLFGGIAHVPGTPASEACAPIEQQNLDTFNDYARDLGVPAVLSEFGCSDDAPDTARAVDTSGRAFTSWSIWTYYEQDCRGILADETQPASRENAKPDKLAALSVPHAQAVAGTPRSTDYDRSSETFTLSYAPEAVEGATLADGARTAIFVPQRHYPHGYDVQVSGARVVSQPTAPFVELQADGSGRDVSVRITPATGSSTLLPSEVPASSVAPSAGDAAPSTTPAAPPATPSASGTAASAGTSSAPSAVRLPATASPGCTRRTSVSLHTRRRGVRSVSVLRNGRPVERLTGRRVGRVVHVDLPRGRTSTIRIVTRYRSGARRARTVVLRPCAVG